MPHTIRISQGRPRCRYYAGNIEYLNGQIQHIAFPDGRLVAEYDENNIVIAGYRAEYFRTDHLGNTRLTFSDFNQDGLISWKLPADGPAAQESEITSENHYYPFGLGQKGPWYASVAPENKYRYNGKEWNDEWGLNMYDYGARGYMPDLGRWGGVDALAEEYFPFSTYIYAIDNPVLFIDPNGMRVDVTDLINGGTATDTRILLSVMADLSAISGSKISTLKVDGKTILVQGECKGTCQSTSADSYISHLLNDDSGEVRIMNNDRNTKKTQDGDDAKQYGSQAYANGDIYMDAGQIDRFMSSLDAAGVNSKTLNFGIVFLHETLHTRFGASHYRKDGRIFTDPEGFTATHKAGETVEKVNIFRREMGLPERASYGGHDPASLRFLVNKKPLDIPIIRKNK